MVEAVANGIQDKLVDGLSFKLEPGASYVTNRRSVTFHPQGSNVYQAGSGTRLIKIVLTGDDWLDPSTFRVAYDVVNLEATGSPKQLRMLGGPHSLFKRARLMCNGVCIEDISDFNRVSQMLQMLKSEHSRQNELAEGFGRDWSEHDYLSIGMIPTTFANGEWDRDASHLEVARDLREHTFKGINAGDSQRVLFKPELGLFKQSKFLPLRYVPITLELELVSSPDDVVLYSSLSETDATDIALAGASRPKTSFHKANCTNNWRIQNVEVKCDLITLDNALDNSYAEHLLSGKSLPINYNTFVSQTQTITNMDKPSVNVSRALTRLKSVFVTLDKDNIENPGFKPGAKSWRAFWSPMSPENGYHSGDADGSYFRHNNEGEFSFQIQIGSKLYPEYPIRSHSEAYYQLKKTLGIQASDVHSFDINPRQYRDNRMVMAIDCEKVLDAGWTGLNTRAGDLMSVKFEFNNRGNIGTPVLPADAAKVGARLADRMHIVLHSDQIMEIRDSGVQVFD
jgi:hypothetical protein